MGSQNNAQVGCSKYGTRRQTWREPTPDDGKLYSPLTSEIDYTEEETQFLIAMDKYRRMNSRPFPTVREFLAVLISLGYRRTEEASAAPVFGVRGRATDAGE